MLQPKPYTYEVTFLPTNQKYYGVRFANKTEASNDLWKKYFTSSKVIKSLIDDHGLGAFDIKIDKVFETKEEALSYEHQFLSELGLPNKVWLNRNVGGGVIWDDAMKAALSAKTKGRPRSDETKEKIRQALKGRTMPEDVKQKLSLAQIGEKSYHFGKKFSADTKHKMSVAKRGKSFDDQHKQALSDAWKNREEVICPHCNTTSKNKGNMTRWHFDNCHLNEGQASCKQF
jgi:hypothetical protein